MDERFRCAFHRVDVVILAQTADELRQSERLRINEQHPGSMALSEPAVATGATAHRWTSVSCWAGAYTLLRAL